MTEPNDRNNRPNILFILADDLGAWAMRCAGNREIETPNLDRLAESGMRFDNFFCASPVCSPARATLMTGRMPSFHGVHDYLGAGNTIHKYEPDRDGKMIEYLRGISGYTDYLAAAGYRCGVSGKWHMGDSHHRQKSFDLWEVHAKGGGPYYNAPMVRGDGVREEPRYITDAITDTAIGWLDGIKNDAAPFYLSVHYTAPHSPWGRGQHPAETYDRYHNECAFESVPDGLRPPDWVRMRNIPVDDAATRRAHLSGYFTAVTEMDRNVGLLIDWLDANGLRDETLVVFAGDNGMCMGHHGVYGKGNATWPVNMFEESVKVPFIVSHTGRVGRGVCSKLLSQCDFMPTLLEYAGLDVAAGLTLPGGSFLDMLRGEAAGENEHIVVYDEYGPTRMARTRDFKYVRRCSEGPDELYSLKDDPGEECNLAGVPKWRGVEDEMRARMAEWFARHSDPERDGTNFPVSGFGQIGLCSEFGEVQKIFRQPPMENQIFPTRP